MSEKAKDVVVVATSAVLGFAAYVLPPYFVEPHLQGYGLFPFVTAAIENLDTYMTMSTVFVIGLVFGFLRPKIWALTAFAPVFILMILASIEMLMDSASHNLWPIEFGIYLAINLPTIVGSFLGSSLRRVHGRSGQRKQ